VNEQPAVLNTAAVGSGPNGNLFVHYGGIVPDTPSDEPPPGFDSQLISSLLSIVDDLTPKKDESAPTKEEKEKRKKDREC
jgi:hypothetical protein